MTGLEKILKHIEEDAVSAADKIVAEANIKAAEILAEAQTEGEKRCAEIAERSKLEVQSCLSRAESAARLHEKKLILSTKQEIIGDVIAKAKESLIKLPDKEYFNILLKMVQKHALAQTGQILFSPDDKKRLPNDFSQAIEDCLKGVDGAALSLSEDTRNVNGGFVLVYGEVEINCSFDALFASAREDLQDKVCQILFI
ncbi:hypothetical protein acsn021_23460 [Anaerocolumna cellulosilytica]|uniref:Uncharacterized protein n=1 Tax=Anaerocolumna cellulosilytica TaxID=433286 RepID=A0A6S6R403_9FIRM|nr:V-type ATP synthase subunit E [Anaerocolumna cellulosilytica]MBB5194009.1 V/A-type H+-transporting ATPase subunit E [Anaerocolumna cellulosilytica]BCJ94777.1 hypothetical protein acsn021_23460 [Anaerocolumna cellulosilytica]